MFKLLRVLKEISLYREYTKEIRSEELNSPLWSRKNLRRDYLNRMYTVINLPPEVLMSNDLPKEARPSFVLNEIKPINDYLKSLNLEELLTVWIEPIKGTNEESYLVVYQFVFREISWLWIFRFIFEISLISFIIYKWEWISNLFPFQW
jgi:hypothetical protein